MSPKYSLRSFLAGFVLLFVLYHFPEFFSAFWVAAVCKIGFLVVAFLLARWQGFKGLGGYGLPLHKGWWANLVKGMALGVTTYFFVFLVTVTLGYEQVTVLPTYGAAIKQLPFVLLMTAVPSLAEDILTRGYLFGHLKGKLGDKSWVLLSATVFYLNHIWRLDDGLAVFAYLFLMGLLLAWAVVYTRSLWLAFGLHWGFNIWYQSTVGILSTNTVNGPAATWMFALGILVLFVLLLAGTSRFRFSVLGSHKGLVRS